MKIKERGKKGNLVSFSTKENILNVMSYINMKWIIADPEICHGKPIFKGTRILVSDIVELIAYGESIEKILEEYPSLNKEMIKEALEYSARIIRGEHYVRFKIPIG